MLRRRKLGRQIIQWNCQGSFHSTWNMICSDEYPEDLVVKYGGYLVKDGEPYSVFSLEMFPKHYLVVFGSLDVSQCKTLDFVNSTFVKCFAGVGKPTPLSFPRSRITCIDYSFRMADDLVAYCTSRFMEDNEVATVLYTDYDDKTADAIVEINTSSILSTNSWLILVIALISLLLIFRLRS